MAKVKLASLLTELSGNVGGVIFANTKSGHTARKMVRPSPKASNTQIARRFSTKIICMEWNIVKTNIHLHPIHGNITTKEWWDYFAAEPNQTRYNVFGDPYQPTGFNCYLEYNQYQQLQQAAMIELPPTAPIPLPWNGFQVHWNHTNQTPNPTFKAPTTSAIQQARVWIYARYDRGWISDTPSTPPYRFITSFTYPAANVNYQLKNNLDTVLGWVYSASTAAFQVRFRHNNGLFSPPVRFRLKQNTTYTYVTPP